MTDFMDLPLDQWTLREYADALGDRTVADLFDITTSTVRHMRRKNHASAERLVQLREVVAADETRLRQTLVTIRATGAFRRGA